MSGPRLVRALAKVLLPNSDREIVIGDLEELHAARSRRWGKAAADRAYARDALASVVARRTARRRPVRRAPRRIRVKDPLLAGWWFDLRAGVRSLGRRPVFTAIATLTLALGVGATTVAFSFVNQMLLRPLPGVRDPDEAAYVQFAPLGQSSISLPDFELLREDASLVDGMATYGRTSFNVTRGDPRPVEVQANSVAGDFFEVLGVRPALGRLLVPSDGDVAGDPLVVVISERLWTSHFGRAPDVVGKRLAVGEQSLVVVGVAGGGFAGPERGDANDLWLPRSAMWMLMGVPLDRMMGRQSTGVRDLLIRPRPGVTFEAVETQLASSLTRIAASQPESAANLSGLRPVVLPGLHTPPLFRERTYRSITLLTSVVGLILLIACANCANLLLFRGIGRRGEVATRRALGASSSRIVRQHIAESLAIAALGTVLGLGAGWLMGVPFRGLNLRREVPFEGMTLDGRVLAFGLAIIIVTSVLFGAGPALLAARSDPGTALSIAGSRDTGRGSGLRAGMAMVQLALSMTLLVGGLLLMRTLGNLYASDTGISFEDVATLNLDLDDVPADEQDAVHRSLVSAVEAVPGVEAAALDLHGPFSGNFFQGRVRPPGAAEGARMTATMTLVTPGWFDVLGVRPVSGSAFRPEDWAPGAPRRVILSQGLARRLFGTENVVGRRLAAGMGQPVDAEIIGVIPSLGLSMPGAERTELFILPFAPSLTQNVTLLARTDFLNRRVLADITAAVERALPRIPVPAAVPLRERVDARLVEERLFARIIALVAGLSVLLAGVGLYGVVAFTVAGRRREMGIRLALGADGRSLAGLIGRYAFGIAAVGMAVGLAGAYTMGLLLKSRLFGVAAFDVETYGATVLVFAAIAALACWFPTRAAMRVDPVVSLRAE